MKRPQLEHIVFGYVFMEVRGSNIQALLLDMQQKGVVLHDVFVKGDRGTVGVCLRDFDAFYPACRKHGVKLRFTSRSGMPFFIRKLRRRKAMLVGIALFFVALYGLGNVIWQVDVSGVEDDSRQLVIQAARELGVYPGSWKSKVPEPDVIQSRLLKKLPNLMWVGVQMDGSKVHIEAVPKVPDVQPLNKTPHDVIAGKPGVIRRVFANRGTVMVKPGQVVHPGDVVISGNLAGGTKWVPADGQVFAEVWYNTRITVPLQVNQSALTGNHVERDYLTLGGLNLRFWGWQQPDYQATYERDETSDWKLGGLTLPVQWKQVTLYEVSPAQVKQSEDDAARNALALAAQDVRGQMRGDGEILEQTVLHREVQHGKLYETILTKTDENIGVAASS